MTATERDAPRHARELAQFLRGVWNDPDTASGARTVVGIVALGLLVGFVVGVLLGWVLAL